MSKPEPIEEPSLEESLALVRRMLAEAVPAPRGLPPPSEVKPAAARPSPALGGPVLDEPEGQGHDLPSILRPPAPGAQPERSAPVFGRLTDALRSVTSYPADKEKRPGLGSVDDDLADLMETGPQLKSETAPPAGAGIGAAKGLAPMDLKGRARVAPSFDGDPRSRRPFGETDGDGARKLPMLEAPATSPAMPHVRNRPLGRDEAEAGKLPSARTPAARLPSLGALPPGALAPPAPASNQEPGGWPRAAARPEPELPGPLSAPPSEPVVIASMPASDGRGSAVPGEAPGSTLSTPAAFMEGAGRRIPPVLPMPAGAAEAREQVEDSRFELIAAVGPAPSALSAADTVLADDRTVPPAGIVEEVAAAPPAAVSGATPIAAAGTEPSVSEGVSAMTSDAAAVPSEPETLPKAVDEVASVLDKLVAGLSSHSSRPVTIAATGPEPVQAPSEPSQAADDVPMSEPPGPAPVMEAQGPFPLGAANPMDEPPPAAATSVVSSPDAFIGGVHGAREEPRAPVVTGSDAMLRLVGTSAGPEVHSELEPPGHEFDDTVAELLRPMLRKWLESNMPRIVEKALRKELAGLQDEIKKAVEDSR